MVGAVDVLHKAGLMVKLMDECLTSSIFPACEQQTLELFNHARNPLPCRHGTSCATASCDAPMTRARSVGTHGCGNCETVSSLNMRNTVDGLCEHGRQPERFAPAADPSGSPRRRRPRKLVLQNTSRPRPLVMPCLLQAVAHGYRSAIRT